MEINQDDCDLPNLTLLSSTTVYDPRNTKIRVTAKGKNSLDFSDSFFIKSDKANLVNYCA